MVERERKRLSFFAEKETQIACVVCAIRDAQHLPDPFRDDETIPLVHEPLARALQAEVVLVAKPRHINGILSLSHPYQNRCTISAPLAVSKDASPVIQEGSVPHRQRPFSANVANEGAARSSGKRNQSDRSPLLSASASTSLLRKISSSADGFQPTTRPMSAVSTSSSSKKNNNNNNSTLPLLGNASFGDRDNQSPLPPDHVKFNRINQTSKKGASASYTHSSTSSSSSAMKAKMMKGNIPPRDTNLRTLSNTAAFLQGKILADSNYMIGSSSALLIRDSTIDSRNVFHRDPSDGFLEMEQHSKQQDYGEDKLA